MHMPSVHPTINSRPPLMSVPPISHSGRCNYSRRDRAKCHQHFLKAIALRHVLLPFFPPFPSRQLPLSINSAHRFSSAISLQTISLQGRGLEAPASQTSRGRSRLHTVAFAAAFKGDALQLGGAKNLSCSRN